MARAIQPFHTSRDGDMLFALTTAESDKNMPSLAELSVRASELAWDAVLNSVPRPSASGNHKG
jgi:L-aminopeptidase/D-esterase-like protein